MVDNRDGAKTSYHPIILRLIDKILTNGRAIIQIFVASGPGRAWDPPGFVFCTKYERGRAMFPSMPGGPGKFGLSAGPVCRFGVAGSAVVGRAVGGL